MSDEPRLGPRAQAAMNAAAGWLAELTDEQIQSIAETFEGAAQSFGLLAQATRDRDYEACGPQIAALEPVCMTLLISKLDAAGQIQRILREDKTETN